MISVTKTLSRYASCTACSDTKNLFRVTFQTSVWSNTLRIELCEECAKELMDKLQEEITHASVHSA